MQRKSKDGGFRALMAAVINRAIDDLKDTDAKLTMTEKDRAMTFVQGEDCEAWCLELGIDHEAVKEKAAALYRRILGSEPVFAPRKSRRVTLPAKPGRIQGPPDAVAASEGRFTGILEKGTEPGFPLVSAGRFSVSGQG